MIEYQHRPHPRRLAAAAALDTPGLVAAGGSIATASLLSCWWVLFLGLLIYGTLFAWKMVDPVFRRKVLAAELAELRRLPDPMCLSDSTLRVAVTCLNCGRLEVARVLEELPDEMRSQVDPLVSALDELEHSASRLVVRAEGMARFLRAVRREGLQEDVSRLRELAVTATDDLVQREYLGALALKEAQLNALDDVNRSYQRAIASLERLIAAIQAIPMRLVRIHVLRAELSEDLAREMDDELDRVSSELLASEQSLALVASTAA